MKLTFFFFTAAVVFASSVLAGKPDVTIQLKENERKLLQNYLSEARDSLQRMIARQYTFKQQTVEQREADKDETDKLREEQTRRENELARIKEERLTREQTLADERKSLLEKQDAWKYSGEQLGELFKKEADGLVEAFPLDKEQRRLELERVRSSLAHGGVPSAVFASFVDYRSRWFAAGDTLSMVKAVVMPEESGPRMLTIARLGNVAAYGVDSAGASYYLRQTGRLGEQKYATEKILAPQVAAQIAAAVPAWARGGRIEGGVPFEVLQNEHARMLISGKKETYWVGLYHTLEKGGWIMVPMFLLIPWVIYLTIRKTSEFSGTGRRMKKEYDAAMRLLEKNDFDGVMTLAGKSRNGLMIRMVQSCIERRAQGRIGGERAVGELITIETPRLSRSLNTLAVIAGAAPLLGLLGTISGMITLFAAVTHYGTGDPKFLANGISEALITAKTGLSIAIPVLFIHDLLRGAKDRLVADIEKRSITVLNSIFPEG